MPQANLGIYSWCVDQIMLEESETGQTIASEYIKPFDTPANEKGIQIEDLSEDFINEFMQLVAWCLGISFVPPKLSNLNNLQITGKLTPASIELVKRMRKRYLEMFDHANRKNAESTEDFTNLEIPVNLEFITE